MKLFIATLLSLTMMFEGWTFLSKPKITLNKEAFVEQGISLDKIIPLAPDNFSQKFDLELEQNHKVNNELQQLNLELLGTAIGNIKDPIAFIKDLKSNKQGIYRLGNIIRDAKITAITIGEVTLDVNGRKETLKLSRRALAWANRNKQTPAILSVSGERVVVSKNGLFSESDNILGILHNVKVRPYHQAREVLGMIVEGVPENSIVTKAGIRDKDIIRSVNNQKIDSYQKALQVFSKVRNHSEIKVGLLRAGKAKTLYYHIEN